MLCIKNCVPHLCVHCSERRYYSRMQIFMRLSSLHKRFILRYLYWSLTRRHCYIFIRQSIISRQYILKLFSQFSTHSVGTWRYAFACGGITTKVLLDVIDKPWRQRKWLVFDNVPVITISGQDKKIYALVSVPFVSRNLTINLRFFFVYVSATVAWRHVRSRSWNRAYRTVVHNHDTQV